MDFIHRHSSGKESIAAIATAPGEGGIAIVRISGEDALVIGDRLFSGPVLTYASHTVHFGRVKDAEGQTIDEVLLLVMHGPRSFTGQDTVEVHCHGGHLIARRVLECALACGARAAQAGEFTYRAFMNGKLDLAQAEAVQEVIAAKSDVSLRAAEEKLQGRLSARVRGFQECFTELAAILEAWVDFPEEGLEFATMEEVAGQLRTAEKDLRALAASYHDGRIQLEGVTLCLVGRPNVGKSSLMNALLDCERAIVTDVAGTTRDTLEDSLSLNGLHVKLVDTAGIREASESIEREGIKRSRAAMQRADLILFVLDAQVGLTAEDELLLREVPQEKTLVVWNKVDLAKAGHLQVPHQVEVSAKQALGLEALQAGLDQLIWQAGIPPKDQLLVTSVRHRDALLEAAECAERVAQGLLDGLSPEFLTFEMRTCLVALGTILGCNITEDVLSSIFSKFCIGK